MQQQKHLLLANIAFKRRPRVTFNNKCANSPADKCKMWRNRAFRDKSVKFGTNLEHMLTNIFSYRAIVFVRCFSQRTKLKNNLAIYIDQTA